MASIPLPALDVRPPEQQPGPLDQFARLQALRNQNLQQQALQQNIQTGAMQQQQMQMKMNSTKAIMGYMANTDNKPYDETTGMPNPKYWTEMVKAGGLPTDVQGMQAGSYKMASDIFQMKGDAQKILLTNRRNFAGSLSSFADNKDLDLTKPDQQQKLQDILNDGVKNGVLTSQQAQQVLAHPNDKTSLKAMANGTLGITDQVEIQAKQSAAEAEKARVAESTAQIKHMGVEEQQRSQQLAQEKQYQQGQLAVEKGRLGIEKQRTDIEASRVQMESKWRDYEAFLRTQANELQRQGKIDEATRINNEADKVASSRGVFKTITDLAGITQAPNQQKIPIPGQPQTQASPQTQQSTRPIFEGRTATGPNGHQIILKDGHWVDAETGKKIGQ